LPAQQLRPRYTFPVPELPDIETYLEALSERILGEPLLGVGIESPFLLRTADPPIREIDGKKVAALRRLGKRVVLALEGEIFLVLHLMVAGRLHWMPEPGDKAEAPRARRSARRTGTTLASFRFPGGTLTLTEAGTRRRAALHLVRGEAGLSSLARAGIEPLEADLPAFASALQRENHTLKRALTDPDLFSGIGNAYSDEILHQAGLSPVKLTQRLTGDEAARLHQATRDVLGRWLARLRMERAGGFPEKVTAFREDFGVHGRYRQPCPRCGAPVQRIVHAENETNYCPRCQTGGQILSDRSLARLLKQDWPHTLEELEQKPGFGLRKAARARSGRERERARR
jgi:formamidopyrimidine-DNA glycosylase